MTYTFNDQAIFEAVAGGKAIVRRPIGMSDKKWAKYADGVICALNNRAAQDPVELGEAINKAMIDDAQESPSMKLVDILARELKVWPEGSLAATQDPDGQINHQMLSGSPVYAEAICAWRSSPGNLRIFNLENLTLSEDFNTAIVTRAEWQAAVDALKADRVEYSPAMHAQRVGRVKRRKVGDCGEGKPGLKISSINFTDLIDLGWLEPPKLDASYSISCEWPHRSYSFGLPYSFDIKSEQPDVVDLMEKMIISSSGKTPNKEVESVEWDGEGLPPVKTVCELSSASKFTEGTRLEEFPAGTRVIVGGKANFGGHDMAVVCIAGGHFCGTLIPSLLRPIRTAEQISAEENARREREDDIEAMVAVSPLLDKGWSRKVCAALYAAGYRKS